MRFDEARAEVLEQLGPRRRQHTLGVIETAARLAKRFGVDPDRAALAALLHDCTKELDQEEQLKLCKVYDIIPTCSERESPLLLHALTGAAVARERYGAPEDVVRAIRWHTTGRAGMTALEKIIYIADYIEPNRSFAGLERIRAIAETDLDAALRAAMEATVRYLEARGRAVDAHTMEALESLGPDDACP